MLYYGPEGCKMLMFLAILSLVISECFSGQLLMGYDSRTQFHGQKNSHGGKK